MQRWATNCLILHNPVKMMRVAYQVRAMQDSYGICKADVDPSVQRRVLVSLCLTICTGWAASEFQHSFVWQRALRRQPSRTYTASQAALTSIASACAMCLLAASQKAYPWAL